MKLSVTLLIAAPNEIDTFYGLNMCKVWMAWKKTITNSELLWVKGDDDGCADIKIIEFRANVS